MTRPARGASGSRRALVATVTLAAVALAAGCASGSAGLDARTARVRETTHLAFEGGSISIEMAADDRIVETPLAATPERVWAVLPAAYAALDIPVTTMLAEQRLVGTPGARAPRRLGGEALSRAVSCGAGAFGQENADLYEVTLLALSDVRAQDGGAVLRTLVRGAARSPGTSDLAVRCASRGRLEQRLAELVRTRLGSAP